MKDTLVEQTGRGSGSENSCQARESSATDGAQTAKSSAPAGRSSHGWEASLLRRLLHAVGDPPIAVSLWNDAEIAPPHTSPTTRLRICDRWTLWKLFIDPLFEFGDAYADGRLEVEGDLANALIVLFRRLNEIRACGTGVDRFSRWFRRPQATSLGRSKENIHHHYDIGNEFYKLWLDERLVYTCAYFADPSWTLEQAQVAKMDHVCRKLRLQPGESVVEAGCGWGALALHMARQYGVTVKAFNIAHEQVVYAREQARREGLEHRVEFLENDWRDIRCSCDAFVSVGMLEHVGRANYELLGGVIRRCLSPSGRGLIHFIGTDFSRPISAWIERRIFPGACPPTLGEALRIFEPHDFSVLDVENLRLHYAETLRHWRARFERSLDTVRAMFDERFVRMWRMYLCGSIAAFETGSLQLFQVLFAPAANNDVPWTRAPLYVSERTPAADEPNAAESAALPNRPR